MHPPEGCTIFRSVLPNQAVATLLLIENSKAMSTIWPNIRDKHLPTLIDTLGIANPLAPVGPVFFGRPNSIADFQKINILVFTSSPGEDQAPATLRQREYYEPLKLQFHHHPDNRVSATTISCGIEVGSMRNGHPVVYFPRLQLLASTGSREPIARHIIIIALRLRSHWRTPTR
jgi:hypothetical protein